MTQIFNTYYEFCRRPDKSVNGVSPEFAASHSNWEADNASNVGCWNCSLCSFCVLCSSCVRCSDCKRCAQCSECRRCVHCLYNTNEQELSDCVYWGGISPNRQSRKYAQGKQKLGAPKNKLP